MCFMVKRFIILALLDAFRIGLKDRMKERRDNECNSNAMVVVDYLERSFVAM